jgi:16S rRNA (guanine527-N7)-methyltransferase
VASSPFAERIVRRAADAGVDVSPPLASTLAAYVGLLARWNRRINLTALPLEPATDEAIDRLVVESLVAAPHAGGPGASVLDVGSGAGSPAIPLKLARPDIRLVMVEARARKCAFLREAVRTLGLEATDVATGRLEDRVRTPGFREAFECVTVRAVRLDREIVGAMAQTLKPGGRLLEFGPRVERPNDGELFRPLRSIVLPGGSKVNVFELGLGGRHGQDAWS